MNRWIPRSALVAVALVAAAYHFLGGEPVHPAIASASVTKNEAPLTIAVPAVGAGVARRAGSRELERAVPSDSLIIPVVGIKRSDLRDTYGAPRSGGRSHAAIDILAPRGTPVVAAVGGEILQLFTSRAGGLTLYLADAERRNVYYYAHLDRYADGLAEGGLVKQGAVLGFVGTSGNAPPHAPHLHFAIERLPASGEWWKGIPENPYPVLMSRGIPAVR